MSGQRAEQQQLERVETAKGWACWTDPSAVLGDPLSEYFGRPGLWRIVRAEERMIRVFECGPLCELAEKAEQEAPRSSPKELEQELCAWARASARGRLPGRWTAPEPERVATWFEPERLSVRAGSHLAKGELECDAKRVRVLVSEIVRFDDAISDARLRWAHELCIDAQSRWHWVRFEIADRRVRAEIDLSGAPPSLAEPLFVTALEALVFSVRWVLPALSVLADSGAVSSVLDRGPWWSQGVATHHWSGGPASHSVPIE